jgi:hypothetical protein
MQKEIFKRCFKLISSRRRRLAKMAVAGCEALQSPIRMQYARNCPPALFETFSSRRCLPCRMTDFCPFCAARRAVDLFEHAWKVKQPEDRLVAFTDYVYWPYERVPLLEVMEEMRKSLKGLVLGPNAGNLRGYFWSAAIEPGYMPGEAESRQQDPEEEEDPVLLPEKKRVPAWVVTRSCLAFMRPRKYFHYAPEGHEKITGRVNRDNLVDAVGLVSRYPVGLFRGNVAQTVEFMNLRGQVRLNERGGCLRNKLLLKEHTDPEG